jgi:inorganic phosphate transporter, PiT family
MLTIIGMMPATYALNLQMPKDQISRSAEYVNSAAALIDRSGTATKGQGAQAARTIADRLSKISAMNEIPPGERSFLRNDLNQVLASLHRIQESKTASEQDRKAAKSLHDDVQHTVQYAPWWVRLLSGLCLGLGTMIGYRRIVKTLGERLGKTHLVPAQGASAELVAAGLIGVAGFTGYPSAQPMS